MKYWCDDGLNRGSKKLDKKQETRRRASFLFGRSIKQTWWIMRKLSPDSFVPSPSSPPVPSLSLSIYIYIHKYIYIHDGGRQSTKTDGGTSGHCRSRSGDSKQPLYVAQCVASIPFCAAILYLFPFDPPPTSFLSSWSFSDNACLPPLPARPVKLFGQTKRSNGASPLGPSRPPSVYVS